jgi:hypothetical protein
MKLDLREIQEGIVSIAVVILLFSITLIVISILFKPYLVLEPWERDYIVLVSGFNIPFCFYYIIEGIWVSTIRELHEKYTSKFIIRTGIVSVLYIPHLIFMIGFLLMDVNFLEKVMVIVVVVLEVFIIGLIVRLVLWKVRNLKRE